MVPRELSSKSTQPCEEESLRRALTQFASHYHEERPHQGKGNAILFPSNEESGDNGEIRCRERLGGILKYYYREAGE